MFNLGEGAHKETVCVYTQTICVCVCALKKSSALKENKIFLTFGEGALKEKSAPKDNILQIKISYVK